MIAVAWQPPRAHLALRDDAESGGAVSAVARMSVAISGLSPPFHYIQDPGYRGTHPDYILGHCNRPSCLFTATAFHSGSSSLPERSRFGVAMSPSSTSSSAIGTSGSDAGAPLSLLGEMFLGMVPVMGLPHG